MLHVPFGGGYGLVTPSWGTTRPAAANGVSVTPQTTNAWGTAVQLHTATIADAYGIYVNINSNAASAASRVSAIQIGIDEAGGTNYLYRIGPIHCGGAAAYNIGAGGIILFFPIFIPRGSTIAVQARGSVATAFRVGTILMQEWREPGVLRHGTFMETSTNSLGAGLVSGAPITPGTTVEGAWLALGTTTKRMWYWQLGVQLTTADTAWGANTLHMDLAVGNATTKDIILTDVIATTDAAENLNIPLHGTFYDVPAGSTLYGRIQNSGTNDAYTMVAYGVGG